MSNISTILYDADGVLINSQMSSVYFKDKYGLDGETTKEFYRGPFLDCLVGKKDMLKELPAFLQKWGWKKCVHDFVHEWFPYEHKIHKPLIDDIEAIRAPGIKCYVATNQEKHRAEYMLSAMGFEKSFDGLLASAHLGATKPEEVFFHRVMKSLNITDPKTILFWDDSKENVDGAKKLGINAHVFSDIESYRKVMDSYGL